MEKEHWEESTSMEERSPGLIKAKMLLRNMAEAEKKSLSPKDVKSLEDKLCREYMSIVCQELQCIEGFIPERKLILRKAHSLRTKLMALGFAVSPKCFCAVHYMLQKAGAEGKAGFKQAILVLVKEVLRLGLYFIPIQNNKIVFDNFGGKGFGDDGKYIAQELLKSGKKLKIYWFVSDPNTYLPEGVRPIKKSRLLAMYHLASAHIWVDNIKNFPKPLKKKEQFYIQTWHSTLGLKKNEADAGSLSKSYVITAKLDASQTDLMYSDNDFRKERYEKSYWYSGKVIKCDVPRMQIMLNEDEALKKRMKEYFNLKPEQKIVLYAPSFRKSPNVSLYNLDAHLCCQALNRKFGGDFAFLLRLHPNETKLSGLMNNEGVFDASDYPDTQELLACADVLITDYSACMFDMCFVGKPVFLYASDLTEYTDNDRELYFSLNELPFSFAADQEKLCADIECFSAENYEKRCEEFRNRIGFDDGGRGAEFISKVILDKIDREKR